MKNKGLSKDSGIQQKTLKNKIAIIQIHQFQLFLLEYY